MEKGRVLTKEEWAEVARKLRSSERQAWVSRIAVCGIVAAIAVYILAPMGPPMGGTDLLKTFLILWAGFSFIFWGFTAAAF